ncbi:MAG TPA: hypothetical protein VK718_12120 [Ferruginibacter sp.]|jgi:hypothetical protein|nr:hypothetical protein [Ferruginibacter sp.]
MKKVLTPEQLEKRKKTNKKIFKFLILPIIIIWIITLIIPKDDKATPATSVVNQAPVINMDSLIAIVKKDSLYDIKDVYYNSQDSSFNIAFTNRDNTIKDKDYTTFYFNETYHLDSLDPIDGVSLYAYKKDYSFAKGDYKKPLTYDSKRLGRINEEFKSKYYDEYLGTYKPLYDYLKGNLNDPESLEIVKSFFIGMNEDSSFEVKSTFRAKNAFGALMMHTVNCDIDMNGNVSNVQMDE